MDSTGHREYVRLIKRGKVFKKQKGLYIMDPHLEEWKMIRDKFSKIDTSEMRFRVECIDNLIISSEAQEQELAHFK